MSDLLDSVPLNHLLPNKLASLKRRALLNYRHPDALDKDEKEELEQHLNQEAMY